MTSETREQCVQDTKALLIHLANTENKVFKAERLPGNYSAQADELVALTEACKLYEGKPILPKSLHK